MYRKFWFNAPGMKLRRKELRNRPTKSEGILWDELKNSKLGYKFIRQYSIGNWVVDFYCPERKIVIEVDGGIHEQNQKADEYRDKYLEGMGMKVIRIKNEEIDGDITLLLS